MLRSSDELDLSGVLRLQKPRLHFAGSYSGDPNIAISRTVACAYYPAFTLSVKIFLPPCFLVSSERLALTDGPTLHLFNTCT